MDRVGPFNTATLVPGYGSSAYATWANANPGAGVPGSVPSIEAWTHAQEEIAYAIEQSGQVPDHTNLHQLWQAIKTGAVTAIHAAPLYGFVALPGTTMTVPSGTLTKVTSYGTVTNTLPTGTTFSGGDLTIGTAADGFYIVSIWLGTNLTADTGTWQFSGAVDVNSISKVGTVSVAVNDAALGVGPFFSGAAVLKLSVGDVLNVKVKHTQGTSQNFVMGFSTIFMGK